MIPLPTRGRTEDWQRTQKKNGTIFVTLWLGTSGVAVPMSCTSQSVFCCILRNFAFTGKSLTSPMDHVSMPRLMFGLTKGGALARRARAGHLF